MMTVLDGLVHCYIYPVDGVLRPKPIRYDRALFDDNDFLNFFESPTGVDPNIRFYEWKPANDGDDSSSNTMYRIMAHENTFVFYLCREMIRSELMYFILRRPRSNSSLCTLVYMFTRPEALLDPPPASQEQGGNSVQIYPASQGSSSDPGHYVAGAFVDPNINLFGTSSHQWFPNADHTQWPTQPDYPED
jgi:hypothetical protein